MARRDSTAETLAALSVAIAAIMEDEVDGAVTSFPRSADAIRARFAALETAGDDIRRLAAAAEVLLRRRGYPG